MRGKTSLKKGVNTLECKGHVFYILWFLIFIHAFLLKVIEESAEINYLL